MLKSIKFFLKFSYKHEKSYVFLIILNQFISGLMPLLVITIPKFIIDELMGMQRLERIIVYASILFIAKFVSEWLITHINLHIFNRRCYLAAAFGEYMHEKLTNCDFSNLESPEFYEIKEKANKFLYGDWHGFSYVFESAFSIIGKMMTSIGIIAIILTMNIGIVMLFLVMILFSVLIDYKSKEKAHSYSLKAVNIERRWNYFTRILEDADYSKEIRMNQIGQWLIDEEKQYAHFAIDFYKKRNICFSKSSLLNAIFNLVQDIITYSYLIIQVMQRTLSIGDFTMYISAVSSFSCTLKEAITNIFDIKVYSVYYEAFNKYIHIKDTLRDNQRLPLPSDETFIIEFQNVSFRYPGQNNYALKNINIKLQSNEKLSIVGENGSGKTTFIKLLCRLYDPTSGEILLNGVNIKEIDYDQYMSMFSAVFQDFQLFSFSIKDNIIWGDSSEKARHTVRNLLENIGLKEKIDTLSKGIDTSVYKEFEPDGFNPSGGEGQKIAIARAMAKDARLIILDEPLSALDPKAEYEIFEQFDSMIKNKTAIYISHRLSTCRFCDLIAVFDKGEICEYGTHDQLVKTTGKYHELYSLQAQYYI